MCGLDPDYYFREVHLYRKSRFTKEGSLDLLLQIEENLINYFELQPLLENSFLYVDPKQKLKTSSTYFLKQPNRLVQGSTKHRGRINTEEKAKIVAAVWGTEFIQFLAALAILDFRTILKNRMNSSFSSNHPGAIHPILQIILHGAIQGILQMVPGRHLPDRSLGEYQAVQLGIR